MLEAEQSQVRPTLHWSTLQRQPTQFRNRHLHELRENSKIESDRGSRVQVYATRKMIGRPIETPAGPS